jgi:hypothetical protein
MGPRGLDGLLARLIRLDLATPRVRAMALIGYRARDCSTTARARSFFCGRDPGPPSRSR